jgi:hypothetical protein
VRAIGRRGYGLLRAGEAVDEVVNAAQGQDAVDGTTPQSHANRRQMSSSCCRVRWQGTGGMAGVEPRAFFLVTIGPLLDAYWPDCGLTVTRQSVRVAEVTTDCAQGLRVALNPFERGPERFGPSLPDGVLSAEVLRGYE